MPADHVKLRFLRPRGTYRKGDVIEYPRGPAKGLLMTGDVELVEDDALPLLETAMVERRDAETADNPRRRRRVR